MLPGLAELLEQVPVKLRTCWIVNPTGMEVELQGSEHSFRPSVDDLRKLTQRYSNVAIAAACGVSEAAVRKWLNRHGVQPCGSQQENTVMTENQIERLRSRAERCPGSPLRRTENRLTKERVGRVIGLIGMEAGIVVQLEDSRVQRRKKFASAHDIRRDLAQRLINAGVSAETLKVVMRHKDFATTERHYGALRSAQSAAAEISTRLAPSTENSAFVGGLVGGHKKTPPLSAEELLNLKSLLARLCSMHSNGLEPLTFGSVDRCSIQLSYECADRIVGRSCCSGVQKTLVQRVTAVAGREFSCVGTIRKLFPVFDGDRAFEVG